MQKPKLPTLKDVPALVVILGVHGGGVANTKWLLKKGAKVSVTDMRGEQQLANSLRQFTQAEKKKIKFILGGQHEEDFLANELILAGPGVPRDSKFLAVAKKANKQIENDASLFFRFLTVPSIGVTGTRGKSTTTEWVAQLLRKKYPGVRASGNTPANPFLKELERVNTKKIPAVVELSSWQCEYLPQSGSAPHVAVITNLYPDHLNRYSGMKDYADAKANIYFNQNEDDYLILNRDNEWSQYFAKKRRKSSLYYTSKKVLPARLNGAFVRNHHLVVRGGKKEHTLFSVEKFIHEYGEHNLENLLAAVLAIFLFDPKVKLSEKDVLRLKSPPMRQEKIITSKHVVVINDSCATSPDGTIAALKRFSKIGNVVLITGGTDKELEFSELSQTISEMIPHEELVLLQGSATNKLMSEFEKVGYTPPVPNHTLEECVEDAYAIAQQLEQPIILFSPGAASFEKFLHEFDRGEKFAQIAKSYWKK